jgi:pimeloyl-ACP methyl ester carboxylesterase
MREAAIDLGTAVHMVEHGASALGGKASNPPAPTFVLVHGLGGSLTNWLAVAEPLAARGRVLALDLAGFGRTPPGSIGAGVDANAALLERFVRAMAPGQKVVVVGNSMGGYLGLRLASEHPELVAGLVLVNPALPIPLGTKVDPTVAAMFSTYLLPGVAPILMRRRAAKVGPEGMVRDMFTLCTLDRRRIEARVFDAHVELARARFDWDWTIDAFLEAARSLLPALANRAGFNAMLQRVTAPTLVLHGEHDRLVPADAARALVRQRPDFELVVHPDAGHVLQLETPEWWLAEVGRWLDRTESLRPGSL